jgi:formylglycine-generating enzyme required for sulfatase activity/CheY-like chemotaxis protein
MKILLVDDDVNVIQALLPALKSMRGHQVRVAIGGPKAIENAAEWNGIDLLVADVFMEPMNGFTLRNKLQRTNPGMKTVFITGYEMGDYAEYLENCPVIIKPVDPEELARVIAEVTTAPRQVATLATQATATIPAPKAAVPKTASPTAVPQAVAPGGAAQIIGDYKIIRKLRDNAWGPVYHALQTSMNRAVVLDVLSPELQKDAAMQELFMANARAKANVRHPAVISVFEAGNADGQPYYTCEFIGGASFADLVAGGKTIDGPTALQTVKTVAEALAYFEQNQIPREPLEASSVYLGNNKQPRLANLAVTGESALHVPSETAMLASTILSLLPGGVAPGANLQALLAAMQGGEGQPPVDSWAALTQWTNVAQPVAAVPADAFKMSAQEEVERQVLEEARQLQNRQLMLGGLSLVSLLVFAGVAIWWVFFRTNEKEYNTMIKIPAGEFIYQDGAKVRLPDFWIDQCEVTIGQYAKFLRYLDQHPEEASRFDHPNQPKGKSHKIKDWEIYYGRAKAGKPVKFIPINLNCPVFLVDWWDAYAYATWKGRRLPTAQEWEKAARGTDGRLYPWGDNWDPKKCNSGVDYNEIPSTPGAVDGYNRWSPVDAISADKSPWGVVGMAGNVSEWTGSWDSSGKFPVIRGGNYHSPDCKVTRSFAKFDPEGTSEYLGFRTVSDQPPGK